MAPISETHFTEHLLRGKAAVVVAGTEVARAVTRDVLSRRDLAITSDSQKVTLGIIALYVVVIAILWNVPYVKWSLWPFKVCAPPINKLFLRLFISGLRISERARRIFLTSS